MTGSPRYLRDQIQRDLSRKMWADAPIDRSLRYFKARFPDCGAWQISAAGTKDYVNADGIRAAPAPALLSTLV